MDVSWRLARPAVEQRAIIQKSKGAPGLAFETWDPRNQAALEAPLYPLSSRAKPRDLQFSQRASACRWERQPRYRIELISHSTAPVTFALADCTHSLRSFPHREHLVRLHLSEDLPDAARPQEYDSIYDRTLAQPEMHPLVTRRVVADCGGCVVVLASMACRDLDPGSQPVAI
jgi:hypothetical protein